MKKPPRILLEHMFKAIEKIEKYIAGYDLKSFESDEKTSDAVVRQFEIIGEAASKIPPELTKGSPIPWKAITGLRHKLIHEYFGVDPDIVWDTASKELTPLKEFLQKLLNSPK